jgi:opacity protein-like surface antigen
MYLAAGLAIALMLPATASAQSGQIEGFGGLTFGDVTQSSTFGGALAAPLSDNLQIIGEVGRITDVTPSLLGTIVDLTPFDLRVSAWYGEAGVRVIGSSHRTLRPYAEATAGFARMSTGFSGVGSRADPIIDAALGQFGRTDPLVGAGGGVLVQGGPLFLDIGYRYKRIFSGNSLQSLITGGDVSVNDVRVGVGVRF